MCKKVVLSLFLCLTLVATALLVYASESDAPSDLYYDSVSFSEIGYEGAIDNPIVINFDTLQNASIYEMLLDDEDLLAQFIEAQIIVARQLPAKKIYSDLMSAFMNDYGDFIYPEHYAGAFLDYDTLVIQVTDMSPPVIAFYTNLLGSDAPIAFQQVAFSFNQLRTYGEMFINSLNAPITSFGYDTMTNTFRIGLYHNNEGSTQTIESFNAMSRFIPLPLTFELETHATDQDLRGGSAIGNAGADFSVGATGTFGVMNAMITTGHSFRGRPVNTPVVLPNGTRIGYLHVFRAGTYSVGGAATTHGDWAIIRLNATGTSMMTNRTRCGLGIHGRVPFAPVGSVVWGTGRHTLWNGVVSAVNVTTYSTNEIDGVRRQTTGLTRADCDGPVSMGGDSGGTISMPGTSNTYFAGVHANVGTRWQAFPPRTINQFHFSPVGHVVGFSPSTW